MKRKRHSPEQVLSKVREAEMLLGEGKSVAEVARQLGVSEQTYHRWKASYGGMKGPEVKRLKDLERENARLKGLVADLTLDNQMLKEVARGNF